MNKNEQQILDYLKDTEDEIPLYTAPNISQKIWKKHQKRKQAFTFSFAASVCAFSFFFWWLSAYNLDVQDNVITKSQLLEHQLNQLIAQELSDEQRLVVTHWEHELNIIDQTIESNASPEERKKLWMSRNKMLDQIVNFYEHPSDLYEI